MKRQYSDIEEVDTMQVPIMCLRRGRLASLHFLAFCVTCQPMCFKASATQRFRVSALQSVRRLATLNVDPAHMR
eukprot:15348480-Alexandrium_andersonii.AAC.1